MEAALGCSPSKLDVIATEAVAALADGQIELPLLPATAMQVFQAAQQPDSDAAAIAKLVQRDQKLATAVLRVANSSAYCPQIHIDTLQQAAARLGMTVLMEIALAAGMKSAVFADPKHLARMNGYWRVSIATAVCAKEIARMRRSNVETAYLCGLLHDVGSPIALKALSVWSGGAPTALTEEDVGWLVARMAPEVGVVAAERWDLPRPVEQAIRYWRDPSEANEHDGGTTIIACAHLLADHFVGAGGALELPHPLFEYLNLYQDQVRTLLDMGEAVLSIVNEAHA